MAFNSQDNNDAHYDGRIKTQTFKQFQLERLVKEGKVILASKLVDAKAQKLKCVREFEEASQEEQRQRNNVSPQPPNDLVCPN